MTGSSGTADALLSATAQTATLTGHAFPASWTGGECNVRLNTSGTLTMSQYSGVFAGDTNDCDSSNSRGGVTGTGVVTWGAAATRVPRTSGYPAIY